MAFRSRFTMMIRRVTRTESTSGASGASRTSGASRCGGRERFLAVAAKSGALLAVAVIAAACSSSQPSSATATTSASHHAKRRHAVAETVTAVSPSSITVRGSGGVLRSFVVTSATQFREGRTSGSESLVTVGERVRVRLLAGASQPTAKAVLVLPAEVTGTVTAVSASGFTLTAVNGASESISTTSGTVYRQKKATVAASALHVGDSVRALGHSSANGSLTATVVSILPATARKHSSYTG